MAEIARQPRRPNDLRPLHNPSDDRRDRGGAGWIMPLGIGLVVALIAGGVWLWYGKDASGQDKSPSSSKARKKSNQNRAAIQIKTEKPRQGGIARATSQPGVVHAYDYVRMYAKASGFLRAQVVDIGDTVKRGQVLAEIYAPELRQAVDQASAATEQARAGVVQAESLVTVARAEVEAETAMIRERKAEVLKCSAAREYRQKEYTRYTEQAAKQVIDERAADEKQSDFQSAKAGEAVALAAVQSAEGQLARAAAQVEKTRADVEAARANLRSAETRQAGARILEEYTRLTAPFDGVVTERNYHDGDFIRAADSGGELPPVLTVARTDLMRVVVYVPDIDVPYVDRGDKSVVTVDSLGGEPFNSVVTRYSNVEVATNRTMRVEIDLPNPTGRLRQGMSGKALIQLEAPPNILAVPSQALVDNNGKGKGSVFLAKDGKAAKTEVRVGRDNGLVAEILQGLKPDDAVIVSYSGSIDDGLPVEESSGNK